MLVLRLGQSDNGGLGLDRLTVRDDRVGDLERNTGVVLLQILSVNSCQLNAGRMTKRMAADLQANLQVKLTSTGDNVLTGLGDPGLDTGVGLGQTLETFDKFGKIGGVLDLDGHLHDGGNGEPHDLHVVGGFGGGEGSALEQELIDTNETTDVSSRAILDGLDGTTHHEDGTLDGLDEQVLLLSGDVVWALDTDLGAGTDSSREDTTEGVEATLVGGGHHLGHVEDEGCLGVTVPDADSGLVVHGAFVEGLHTVLLGGCRGWQVNDYHLQEGLSSRKELAHDDLEEGLALEVDLLRSELDVKLGKHGGNGVLLEVHDGVKDTEDGVQHEHVESTLEGLAISTSGVGGPLFGGGVEVVVAPQLAHHLGPVHTELLRVTGGELPEGETPAVKTGTKGNGSLVGVDLDITEGGVVVGGDDDVDGLNCPLESLVQVLLLHLQLEQSTVNLVDDDNGLDTLGQGLTEHGFCLYADTFDTVDDDEGAIGDTKGGGDF